MQMIQRGPAFLFLVCSAVLLCAGSAAAHSEKLNIIYSFCTPAVCPGGEDVPNPVISDSAGNLFGTTLGGADYKGAAYELRRRPGGRYKIEFLHVFDLPVDPVGVLVMDTKGNLYGVAEGLDQRGDSGQIFELSPQKDGGWTEKTLYDFCPTQPCTDGELPPAGLAYANQRAGALYDGKSPLFGVTKEGGAHYGGGTVFELRPTRKGWVHRKLYDFCSSGHDCADGLYPEAQLLVDASGNLFGTTTYGGKNGGPGTYGGAVFELTPGKKKWTETILYSFCDKDSCADGAFPQSPLTFDSSGNLYGFTSAGGAPCDFGAGYQGCGVAYKIVRNGVNSGETVLHNFCTAATRCRDGAYPASTPVLDGNGNLFGMALAGGIRKYSWLGKGGGTFFEFSLADPNNTFRVLHRFCQEPDRTDGERPLGFIGNPSEATIGVANMGGKYGGGAVFRLTLSRSDSFGGWKGPPSPALHISANSAWHLDAPGLRALPAEVPR